MWLYHKLIICSTFKRYVSSFYFGDVFSSLALNILVLVFHCHCANLFPCQQCMNFIIPYTCQHVLLFVLSIMAIIVSMARWYLNVLTNVYFLLSYLLKLKLHASTQAASQDPGHQRVTRIAKTVRWVLRKGHMRRVELGQWQDCPDPQKCQLQ